MNAIRPDNVIVRPSDPLPINHQSSSGLEAIHYPYMPAQQVPFQFGYYPGSRPISVIREHQALDSYRALRPPHSLLSDEVQRPNQISWPLQRQPQGAMGMELMGLLAGEVSVVNHHQKSLNGATNQSSESRNANAILDKDIENKDHASTREATAIDLLSQIPYSTLDQNDAGGISQTIPESIRGRDLDLLSAAPQEDNRKLEVSPSKENEEILTRLEINNLGVASDLSNSAVRSSEVDKTKTDSAGDSAHALGRIFITTEPTNSNQAMKIESNRNLKFSTDPATSLTSSVINQEDMKTPQWPTNSSPFEFSGNSSYCSLEQDVTPHGNRDVNESMNSTTVNSPLSFDMFGQTFPSESQIGWESCFTSSAPSQDILSPLYSPSHGQSNPFQDYYVSTTPGAPIVKQELNMYFGMFRCNVCGAIGEESVVKNHVMEHYQYPSQFQHGYLWNGASLIPVIGYRSATGVGLNSDGGMGQPAPILEYGQLLPRSQVSESAPKTRNGAPSRKLGTLEDLTCHLCGKALNSKRTLKSHLRVGADGIETCVALQGRPLTSAAATPIFSGSSSIYSNTPSHPTSAFATSAMRSPPFTVQVKKELLQTGSSQRTPENFQDAFEGGLSAVTVPNARTVAQSVVAPANVDDVEIDVLKASGGSAGHFYVQLPGRTEINRVYYVPGPSALGRTPKEMDTVNVFSRVVNDDRGISEGKMNTRAISNAQSAQKSLPKIIINEPNFTSYNGEHQHEGRKRKLAICESEDSPRGSKAVFDSESGTGYDKKQRTISNSSSGSTAFETLRHELSLTGTAQSSPLPQRSEVQTSLEQPLVQFGLCEDDELYGSNVSSFSFQDFFENHLSSE